MSTIIIRYASKHLKDADGIIQVLFSTKKIHSASSKRYHNCLHKTSKLTPSARNLLDYIVERMNKNSEIANTQLFKMEYLEFMDKNCGITYSDETVNKGFQELKRVNLLVSFEHRKAVYIVNPLHFYRGTEAERKTLLQRMLNATPDGKYLGTNLAVALGVE